MPKFVRLLNGKIEKLNSKQKLIVASIFPLVLFIITIAIASKVGHTHFYFSNSSSFGGVSFDPDNKAVSVSYPLNKPEFDWTCTWYIWLLFLMITGYFEFNLFASISDKEPDLNTVDTSWFLNLLKNKKHPVDKENMFKMIQAIEWNWHQYGDNDEIAKQKSSEKVRDLVEMWKEQYLKTATLDIGKYKRDELSKVLVIPFRKKIFDYEKDINYVEQLISNPEYRRSFDIASRDQELARNRFLRPNRSLDAVPFLICGLNLSKINLRMFENSKELKEFSDLISTKIENATVDDFIKKADDLYRKYIYWNKQFNDHYVPDNPNNTLEDGMLQLRKDMAHAIITTQFVNKATNSADKKYIDSFIKVDIYCLNPNELSHYEKTLKQLLSNPDEAGRDLIKFVNRQNVAG